MRFDTSKTLSTLLSIAGLLGLIGFSGGFFSSFSRLTLQDVFLTRVPLVTSFLLILVAIGLLLSKRWAQGLGKLAALLWATSGVVAVHFSWSFHPWAEPNVWQKLTQVCWPLVVGIIFPCFVLVALSKTDRRS